MLELESIQFDLVHDYQSSARDGIQALIAGAAMPSGWHLLGRTPVKTFVATRHPPVLFEPGDEVVFEPIDASRWDALDARAQNGDPIAEVVAA